MERLLICSLVCACFASMVWGAPQVLYQQQVLCSQLRKNVENLMNVVKKDDAEELYTPIDDEEHCLSSAVSCFINATLFLKPIEQPTANKIFNETLSRIQSVRQNFLNSTSELKCPPCTDYPKQSPRDFLDKFRLRLQQLYRIYGRSQRQLGHEGY